MTQIPKKKTRRINRNYLSVKAIALDKNNLVPFNTDDIDRCLRCPTTLSLFSLLPRVYFTQDIPIMIQINPKFCFAMTFTITITQNFSTCHDSCAVMACAKLCSDLIDRKRINTISFHVNLKKWMNLSETNPFTSSCWMPMWAICQFGKGQKKVALVSNSKESLCCSQT